MNFTTIKILQIPFEGWEILGSTAHVLCPEQRGPRPQCGQWPGLPECPSRVAGDIRVRRDVTRSKGGGWGAQKALPLG